MTISLNLLQFVATVLGMTVGGGFTLWNLMSGKIAKAQAVTESRILKLEGKTESLVDKETLRNQFTDIGERLDRMENIREKFVTRDEYAEGQRRLEAVLSRIADGQSQATATLTARMDAVLFKVGEKHSNG